MEGYRRCIHTMCRFIGLWEEIAHWQEPEAVLQIKIAAYAREGERRRYLQPAGEHHPQYGKICEMRHAEPRHAGAGDMG